MKKILPFFFLMLTGGVSCKKFLAAKSQSDVTPTTTVDFSQLLMGTGYPTVSQVFAQQILFMDDDMQAYAGPSNSSAPQELQQPLPAFSWQPDYFQQMENNGFDGSGNTIDGYKNYYANITGCNIAIQYTDGSIGTQADKDYLKGQAYGLRAYYYLMLVNLYGRPYNDSTTTPDKSPGVPLMLTANLSDSMPGRNSVAQIYHQILADLDSACGRLDGAKRTDDIYRFNHVSAHLLASRTNLYLGQWDSVISNASYAIQYHPTLMNLNSWPLSSGWSYGSTPFLEILDPGNAETIWSYGAQEEYFTIAHQDGYGISQDLANQYDPNDLRAQIYFSVLPPFFAQYFAPPYSYQKVDFDKSSGGYAACSFRSSEAYLNRAEAYAEKYLLTGDNSAAQNALNDLNTLRAKRFDPSTFQPLGAMTPDSLLQFCRNERRRELSTEGYHRWFDLRRYGMPSITHYYQPTQGTTLKYVLTAHDPQYTLPIPNDAILLNTNLVQNPLGPERQPSN